jgi:hypothetical protein
MVAKAPALWQRYYQDTDRGDPQQIARSNLLRGRAEEPLIARLNASISSYAPAAIVCTHFLPAEVLVVRTRRPFFRSRPSPYLLATTLAVDVVTLQLLCSPINGLLGFTPLPLNFLALLAGIVALYVLTAELVKKLFYQHVAW